MDCRSTHIEANPLRAAQDTHVILFGDVVCPWSMKITSMNKFGISRFSSLYKEFGIFRYSFKQQFKKMRLQNENVSLDELYGYIIPR